MWITRRDELFIKSLISHACQIYITLIDNHWYLRYLFKEAITVQVSSKLLTQTISHIILSPTIEISIYN